MLDNILAVAAILLTAGTICYQVFIKDSKRFK